MANYQIQVNALVSADPAKLEELKERIEKAFILALKNAELLDGVFIDVQED
jgi:hypothetical protein